MEYASVFQPGFRGTSGFPEWLPGVPPNLAEIIADLAYISFSRRMYVIFNR